MRFNFAFGTQGIPPPSNLHLGLHYPGNPRGITESYICPLLSFMRYQKKKKKKIDSAPHIVELVAEQGEV